jgi:DNA-binding beta-propeller fold protein YncE
VIWLLLACTSGGETDTGGPGVIQAFADAGPDVVVEVGQEVQLDGSASEGVEFVWDFGDGLHSEKLDPTHTWTEPGNYSAVIRATGSDGGWDSDAARVLVHRPLPEVAPSSSGMLAIDEQGALYAVVPEAGTVAIVTPEGEASIWPVCADPISVAVRAGEAAVACGDDAVVLFTAATPDDAVRIALPEGSHPRGVAAGEGRFWVTLSGLGEVAEVLPDGTFTRHAVGSDPRAVAVNSDGSVWITRFRTADGGAGEIYRLGSETALLPELHGSDSDTSTRGLPNLLESVVFTPDGATAWVGASIANVNRGMVRDGQPLTFETTIRAMVLGVDAATGLQDESVAKQFDNQGTTGALAFTPLGDRVWVAHPLTGTLHELDRYTGDITGSLVNVGHAVTGVQLSPDGNTLYAYAWLDRTVTAWDVSDPRAVPAERWSASVVDDEPLAADVLLGKQLFHDAFDLRMARDGYMTCAACHPGGEHDGRTWDFTDRGEGLRNTASLQGRAGTGMGPLHWTANFDEIHDFENDIRNGQGGAGLLSDDEFAECSDTLGAPKAGRSDDLDALAAFVATLDTTPRSPFPDSPDGEALFTTKGCAECHPAPLFTDSSLETFVRHDVGTWRETSGGRLGGDWDGFDTPTLLGAWATGPWLHDGRAATIEQAITAHSDVTDEEATVLADFVRSL